MTQVFLDGAKSHQGNLYGWTPFRCNAHYCWGRKGFESPIKPSKQYENAQGFCFRQVLLLLQTSMATLNHYSRVLLQALVQEFFPAYTKLCVEVWNIILNKLSKWCHSFNSAVPTITVRTTQYENYTLRASMSKYVQIVHCTYSIWMYCSSSFHGTSTLRHLNYVL